MTFSAETKPRIYLSPPHMSGLEQKYIQEAFDTNWIAPLGPNVNGFEEEFAELVGSRYAAALISGTAALHLALILAGVEIGDEVLVSDLTFSASVNPIIYQGGRPTFIDCERISWNMDPGLLRETLRSRAKSGKLPKAVVLVHLYGQSANLDPIIASCEEFGVTLIEDAAEALGTTYRDKSPGVFGKCGIFSFNGNKIITTSGGGMLVSDDEELIAHARKLSTQARDEAAHYQHSEIGYNYRMSNILAGVGRGQIRVLADRVQKRRKNFEYYKDELGDLPGIEFMPEAPWGQHSRWLTVLTIDPKTSTVNREKIRLALEAENIEARPVWKPMHLQPVFDRFDCVGGEVAKSLFINGLCLPSGSSLESKDLKRVVGVIKEVFRKGFA